MGPLRQDHLFSVTSIGYLTLVWSAGFGKPNVAGSDQAVNIARTAKSLALMQMGSGTERRSEGLYRSICKNRLTS